MGQEASCFRWADGFPGAALEKQLHDRSLEDEIIAMKNWFFHYTPRSATKTLPSKDY